MYGPSNIYYSSEKSGEKYFQEINQESRALTLRETAKRFSFSVWKGPWCWVLGRAGIEAVTGLVNVFCA